MNERKELEYLVVGAGGTGAPIAAYMTQAGKCVTLIARGAHLAKIQESGLRMETLHGNYTVSVNAVSWDGYQAHPDVIFVCVKGYSLKEIIPELRRVSKKDTVIVPVLNIYGTGSTLQAALPDQLVTDGCIYIASEIREPGTIWMNGEIFRIVFGARTKEEYRPVLEKIAEDLTDSGITPVLSDHVQRDTMKKYIYISPAAACGEYYHAAAGEMQKPGEVRDCLAELMRELAQLAEIMGIVFDTDVVRENLDILDGLQATASTSMQRDILAGRRSEIKGLVFNVPELAEKYGVRLPMYEKITAGLRQRGFGTT